MRKFFLFATILSVLGCQQKSPPSPTDVFIHNLDTTVLPANDFFEYANGSWIKNNPIPSDQSSWGIGGLVYKELNDRLLKINEDAVRRGKAKDAATIKTGLFWKAAMDSQIIESQGIQYLQPWLDSIHSITDIPSFLRITALLHTMGISPLLDVEVGPDDKNSSVNALFLSQGGIGLPNRDYYFRDDTSTIKVRRAYLKHLTDVLMLLGKSRDSAKVAAGRVYTIETRLAIYSKTLAEERDPFENYHKMAISGLGTLSSSIHWPLFLKSLGVISIDSVVVRQPKFIKSFDQSLGYSSIPALQDYLAFHLVNNLAEALPEKFGKEAFQFSKALSGAKERLPRWKRALRMEQSVIGELVGQLYVKKYFDTSSKARYEKMAQEISDAYKARIQKLTWMSDSTKEKAIYKLEKITRKIGYPDKWKDFSDMKITSTSYMLNMINAQKWWYQYSMNKLGKPVDRTEWYMTPQTYNAYYNPSANEIVFPAAAFLIPGYSDKELDDAVMYGYVGASYIGHEITHGFDDQGRLYDADGNLRNWWSPEDSAAFTKRAALIIKQFNEFEPLPGYHINGEATQGENIADLGGLEIGLDAFKKSNAYKDNKTINGFSPMDRFFIGYALSWMYEMRPELLRMKIMTDVHAPAKYRVLGPMSNVDEFYKNCHVTPDDKMYRPDSLRVKIW